MTKIKVSKHMPSVFQGRLDFSATAKGLSLSKEHPLEGLMLKMTLGLIMALLFSYLYFVSASVLNVIARKEALSEITKIQSAIALQEKEYFALSEEVKPQAAERFGLAPVQPSEYVYRADTTVAATMGANEI